MAYEIVEGYQVAPVTVWLDMAPKIGAEIKRTGVMVTITQLRHKKAAEAFRYIMSEYDRSSAKARLSRPEMAAVAAAALNRHCWGTRVCARLSGPRAA